MLATLHAIEQPTMRLYALLCVVLTSSFHTHKTPADSAKAESRDKSPYEVLGVRTSAKPDESARPSGRGQIVHPDVVLAKATRPRQAGDARGEGGN